MTDNLIPNFDKLIQDQWFPSTIRVTRNGNDTEFESFILNINKDYKIFDNDITKYKLIYIPKGRILLINIHNDDKSENIIFNVKDFKDVKRLTKQLCDKSGGIHLSILNKINSIESGNNIEKITPEFEAMDEPSRNIIIVD